MKLSLDTTDRDKTFIKIDERVFVSSSPARKSQQLLELIAHSLESTGCRVGDIKEISLSLGPGSFTGLKVGTTVANTFGFILDIPVNGKNVRAQGGVVPYY